ncbi:MAG: hypothetical protein RLZZ422_1725 [Pseudomonadota bacterium]|jgi:dipeptidyl-peptidase-4
MLPKAVFHWLLIVIITLVVSPCSLAGESTKYREYTIREWTIHYDNQLMKEDAKKLLSTLVLLDDKLEQITQLVPKVSLKYLQAVPIWISNDHGEGLVYHASSAWLVMHGRNPAMSGAVELQHLGDLSIWSESQPLVLLHELAHGLHHRLFNYNHRIISASFRNATILGLYQSVQRYDGSYGKAYALEDEREYFAELTEAYFGTNDYYPFNRQQLKEYDPIGHAMIETIWYSDIEQSTPTWQATQDSNHEPAATRAP